MKNTLRRAGKFAIAAIAVLAITLVVNAPGEARGMAGGHAGGGHPAGGHPGGFAHQGFDGHHGSGDHHGFNGHHGFVGPRHFGFGFVPVFPYSPYGYYPYAPPAYGGEAPAYWYYCPSAGAYYPNVTSCPEPWQPVPAS